MTDQTPSAHVAVAVLALASGDEQSTLPYVHTAEARQHAGQAASDSGGIAGQVGSGSGLFP